MRAARPLTTLDSQRAIRALAALADGAFATPCAFCNAPITFRNIVCADCARKLPWLTSACIVCAGERPKHSAICGSCVASPPPIDRSHAMFAYAPPIDRAVLHLKYSQRLVNARLLGELFALYLGRCGAAMPDAILPVPSHATRMRQRGFNPAAEIAAIISRRLAIRLDSACLARVGERAPQERMSGRERRNMPLKTFAIQHKPPAFVAVVDDVLTTGATLRAIAAQLKRVGAKRVDAWVISKTVRA